MPPVTQDDRNAPRVYLDPFDKCVLHLSNLAPGQTRGSFHGNMKVPDFLIGSMIETLDDRAKELLVVVR